MIKKVIWGRRGSHHQVAHIELIGSGRVFGRNGQGRDKKHESQIGTRTEPCHRSAVLQSKAGARVMQGRHAWSGSGKGQGQERQKQSTPVSRQRLTRESTWRVGGRARNWWRNRYLYKIWRRYSQLYFFFAIYRNEADDSPTPSVCGLNCFI